MFPAAVEYKHGFVTSTPPNLVWFPERLGHREERIAQRRMFQLRDKHPPLLATLNAKSKRSHNVDGPGHVAVAMHAGDR